MSKPLEFEARVYCNKRNDQFNLIPIKKNLSKEVRALMDNPNVEGFKMEVVEALSDMPTPKLKLNRELLNKRNVYQRRYLDKKNRKEVTNKNDKINSNK